MYCSNLRGNTLINESKTIPPQHAQQMKASELEAYLYQQIPVSKLIGISVLSADADQVVLRAPLQPNINHCDTVFGGSASAVAILAAWSLIHLRLTDMGIASRIVIQRNTIEYTSPIPGDFTATATPPDEASWHRFFETLRRRGKARIQVSSVLEYEHRIAGKFTGDFVALRPSAS